LAPVVVSLGLAVGAASAGAAASYQLKVSPTRVAQGGKVVVQTVPRRSCALTVTIAGTRFSHPMRTGWAQIALPRNEATGRVTVKTDCAGQVSTGAFTITKK
jgi:DNA-binding transcriptional regulator YdaS (Cro superfamily)